MPRKKIHPSMIADGDNEELMSGGLEDGHEFRDEPIYDDPDDDDDDDLDDPEDDDQDDDRYAKLERQVQRLMQDNENLRRSIPPAAPPAPAPEPDEEPDWEDLLFRDPAEALRLHGERVAKSVETKLRREYQADRSQARFWEDFYKANSDLKDDDDLVRGTLQGNFNEIANLPTPQAIEKLADLTRERIMRYTGNKPKRARKRPQTEGANPPTPRSAPAPTTNVTSLGSVIRNRKLKRAKGAAA